MFRSRAEHQPELAVDGLSVFLGILESKIDHLADALEDTYRRLEQLSRRVLDQAEADLQSDRVVSWGSTRITFHDTRHTWATLALQAGVHPKVVSERLGHASVAFTLDVYSHAIRA